MWRSQTATVVEPLQPQIAAAAPKGVPFLEKAYDAGEQLPSSWGVCLYGKVDTRKTSSVRTMPGHGWLLDFPTQEGGSNVLGGYSPRIKVRPMETWDDLDTAFWYFLNNNPKLPRYKDVVKKGERWADNDPRWDTVRAEWLAVDTATAAQDVAKHHILGGRGAGVPGEKRDLGWKEYDAWYSLVQQGIYSFKTIPDLVTLWLAQERKVDPSDDNPEGRICPNLRDRPLEALEPSMMLIARYFLGRLPDGQPDYRAQILPSMNGAMHIIAKTRHRVDLPVPMIIRNIHLGNLLAYTLRGIGSPPEEVIEEPPPVLEFVA